MQAPSHELLQEFLLNIKMVFNIVDVSPQGYFEQQGVLGKPDSSGQIVYILDQVEALEQAVKRSIKISGVTVTSKISIPIKINSECRRDNLISKLE